MATVFNKTDLVNKMAEVGAVSKTEAEKQLNNTLTGMKAIVGNMKPEDKLQLVGNLTLEVAHREAREGHNPKKPSEKVNIPAKNVLKIKAGSEFAGAVKQPK